MTETASLRLYELAGADSDLRFSPHCWKTRMALAHKGLEVERLPLRFTDKDLIAFTGQPLVPVLVAGEQHVNDSWNIALFLEEHYPDRPSLFGGAAGRHLSRFVNAWADSTLVPHIARIILLDILAGAHEKDRDYFRASREKRFDMTLEAAAADTDKKIADFRAALLPLRLTLKAQPFLAGDAPAYADYCVFGMFMWARCISPKVLLAQDDPIYAWREMLLDAFGGLARNAPTIAAV